MDLPLSNVKSYMCRLLCARFTVHGKGQLISKADLKNSFEPKNQLKYFSIDSFLRLGQKYKNIFVGFLVQMKTFISAFEIN